MNRIVEQFEKSFGVIKSRKDWPKIYVAVDIHETCVVPTWSTKIDDEFYEDCKETLQMMSEDKEVCLILWSCSREELNVKYREFFATHDINFDYINENPECPSTTYANFERKLYFNVGLDDKFAFRPKAKGRTKSDWYHLRSYFIKRKWARNAVKLTDELVNVLPDV